MAKILNPINDSQLNIPVYTPGEDISRLEEMYDAMQDSIDNANRVIAEQTGLIEVIEKSDKADDLKDLVESLKEQNSNIAAQVETLGGRRTHFELLKQWVNENPEKNDEVLHSFVEFLGVFSGR